MFNRTHFKKFYRAKTQRKISSYFSELGVLCVFAGLIFFPIRQFKNTQISNMFG
jgi:hypothetical protein